MKERILIWILMFRFRPSFYPEGSAPRGKNNNADAVVEWNNGKQWVVDFKYMPGNGGNLSKRLLEAYEQADYAVVMITGTVNIDAIINMANSFLKNRPSFKMVIIYGSNGELIYKKGNA